MMLARENIAPSTMHQGVTDPSRTHIVVPAGIGHYSVKSALEWIGCGGRIIEVPTRGYRYDLAALERTLAERPGEVLSVVAYTGDSRTHTVENLRAVHDITRAADPRIWLHADVRWGLMCAFTPEPAGRLNGIKDFDSVTVDPHKVMDIPYAMSALLVRDPAALRLISSYSDLIMQEDFAFGQVTPFIGTKEWSSIKLWAMMRAHGRSGLADLMRRRLITTRTFTGLVDDNPRLLRLNDPGTTAVVFLYLPTGHDPAQPDAERINTISRRIHARILEEGRWHFHQFSVPDDTGRLQHGATLYPLRFMGNPQMLNSPAFERRLLLNALTTPHLFLTGDVHTYRRHVAKAERGCALLALRIAGAGQIRLADATSALLASPEGLTEKRFLGYRPGPHLYAVLRRGLADLAHEHLVHLDHDAITWRPT